jgi:hypothetical protein
MRFKAPLHRFKLPGLRGEACFGAIDLRFQGGERIASFDGFGRSSLHVYHGHDASLRIYVRSGESDDRGCDGVDHRADVA